MTTHIRLLLILTPVLAALCILPARAAEEATKYPPARKSEQVDDYHGVKVADPYRWLEDPDSDETRQWVQRENAVTFEYLRRLPMREPLRRRLTELWNYPRFTSPFREGGRYFFFKNDGLQNQHVLYVQDSLHGEPRVLFDPNALSADGTIAVGPAVASEDGKLLAYALARAGSDWQELRIRSVDDGKDLSDELKWIKFSGIGWTKDSRGFFYSRFPEPDAKTSLRAANKHHKLYYHIVGTPQAQDVLVYERTSEPDWLMTAGVTEDGRYAILSFHKAGEKNRVSWIDLKDPHHPDVSARAVDLIDNFDAAYSFIGNDGPLFYFRTDANSPLGRAVAIDVAHPKPDQWKTLIPESKDTLQSVHLLGDQFVALYLHDAHSQIRSFDLAGKPLRDWDLPALGSVGGFAGRRDQGELFYSFTSFLNPPTIYRYDAASSRAEVFRAPAAKFDASPYETQQIFVTSKDGTRIPVFVTHRKGFALDGSHPTYLTGYGGFNISRTPAFSVPAALWLEHGGVYALANLRGGGEFGEAWHHAGTKLQKQNVFDDFIASAEGLIHLGYTSPKRLAIAGGSNGGLLVGAVLNQRPDLFAAAVPAVGVMDMLRFHKFTIGHNWTEDYGSSDDAEQFKAIYAYSPLHNIKAGAHYPATLIMTADHDDRVVPGHSFKYAATLQAAQGGPAPILIRLETKAGHGGGKPTSKLIEEEADAWAFVMHHLGMDPPTAGAGAGAGE
jgi:prolyl oligopeptidase